MFFLDLVITAVKKEKSVSTPGYTYPSGWYYHNPYYYHYPSNHYYLHHYNYNYTTYVTQKVEYTEGAITLNIIDRKLNKLVWTGTTKSSNGTDVGLLVDSIIATVMQEMKKDGFIPKK